MGPWDDIPPALRPKELMFFSADVIGSTAVKQTYVPTGDVIIPDKSEWFKDLQTFYISSVDLLKKQYEELGNEEPREYLRDIKTPKVWKTVGDEILFWVEVTDSRQVVTHLEYWMAAITKLREVLFDLKLDVKCTSWIAHFPWRNKLIFTSPEGLTGPEMGIGNENLHLMKAYFESLEGTGSGIPQDLIPDFVGPGMDIGFRLTHQSTQLRFVVSTDVIYMLCKALLYMRLRYEDRIRVHFEGLHLLKGVLQGLEYPIFWLDMSQRDDIYMYGNDLRRRTLCTPDQVIKFMDNFYGQRFNYMYPPFIVSGTEKILTQWPDWYYSEHMKMLAKAGFDFACFEAEQPAA